MTNFLYGGETPPNVSDNLSPFSGVSNLSIIVSTQPGKNKFNNSLWKNFGTLSYDGSVAYDFSYEGQNYMITSGLDAVNGYCTLVGVQSGTTALNLSSTVQDVINANHGGGSAYYCIINKVADYAFYGNSTITHIGNSHDYMTSIDNIGFGAFANCSALTAAFLDADTISNSAFAN